jgi:outer membrane protein assembly factor BamB
LVALLVVASFGLMSCDWLQAGYGPGRSNANPFEPALTPEAIQSLSEAFSISLPAGSVGDPIVVNGSLVVASHVGTTATVSAFDSATGAPKWSVELPGAAASVTAVASDGNALFVATTPAATGPTATVHALRIADGSELWTYDDTALPGGQFDQMLVVGSEIVVATSIEDTSVPPDPVFGPDIASDRQVLDAATGAVAWASSGSGGKSPSSYLAADDGTLIEQYQVVVQGPSNLDYLGTYINAIGIDDGHALWTNGCCFGTPWLGLAQVYMATGDQLIGLFASVPATPPTLSIVNSDGTNPRVTANDTSTPLAAGGGYLATTGLANAGTVTQLTVRRTSDLSVAWSADFPAGTTTKASIAGSVLYVTTTTATGPELRTYQLTDGTPISTMAVPAAVTPVVSNGRVYLTSNGTLHAFAPA